MGGRLNKLVALNFISVCLFSLGYRTNRVIALGVSSVFLFALGVYFVGSWRVKVAVWILPEARVQTAGSPYRAVRNEW